MSDDFAVPLEGTLSYRLGLELKLLASSDSPTDTLLQVRQRLLQEMLARDPHSVISIVPSAATGANGLRCSVGIRDEVRWALALAADS